MVRENCGSATIADLHVSQAVDFAPVHALASSENFSRKESAVLKNSKAVKTKASKATKAKAAKAPKAKKPKPMSGRQKTKLIGEKVDELLVARREYQQAASEWAQAHAHAGERKKNMERCQAELNGIVNDIEKIKSGNYNLTLPFKGDLRPKKGKSKDGATDNAEWRSVKLSTILDGDGLKLLEAALIDTVGQLTDHLKFKPLTAIEGIGPGRAAVIGDKMEAWWKTHPDYLEAFSAATDPEAKAETEAVTPAEGSPAEATPEPVTAGA